jgi:hypothetical protein
MSKAKATTKYPKPNAVTKELLKTAKHSSQTMDYFKLPESGCWVSIRGYGALICHMKDHADLKVTDDPKSIAAGKKLIAARKATAKSNVVSLPKKNPMEQLQDKVAAGPRPRRSGVKATKIA